MHFQPLVHQPGGQNCLSQLSVGRERKSRDLQSLGKLDIRGKKLSQALQVTTWKDFPAEEPRSAGRSSSPGPAQQAAVVEDTGELLFHLNFSLQGAH